MSRKIQKVILLLDNSGSMQGQPILELKRAVNKLSHSLEKYDRENSRVDLQIISFATEAKFVSKHKVNTMKANGRTNLADAYKKLNLIFNKHKFFDYPPIILLMCDGRPNLCNHQKALQKLNQQAAFRDSMRIAIAYGKQDGYTLKVLNEFAGSFENVLQHESISTINYLIEYSLPKTLKEQAKNDNKCYSKLMQLIKCDTRKHVTFNSITKKKQCHQKKCIEEFVLC